VFINIIDIVHLGGTRLPSPSKGGSGRGNF
jgi:hypothetical protein